MSATEASSPTCEGEPQNRKRERSWSEDSDGVPVEDRRFTLMFLERGKEKDDAVFTDLVLVIEAEDDGDNNGITKRSFCVHRPVLAAVSDYFAVILTPKDSRFAESNVDTITLKFPEMAVRHFEMILLCAYRQNFVFNTLSAAQICGLFFLADYFQMTGLFKQIKYYLRKWQQLNAISFDAPDEYYECSQKLHLPFIREFLIHWGKNSFPKEEADRLCIEKFMIAMDTDLFLEIFQKCSESETMVERAAFFCAHREDGASRVLDCIADVQDQSLSFVAVGDILASMESLYSPKEIETMDLAANHAPLARRCVEWMYEFCLRKATMEQVATLTISGYIPKFFKHLVRHSAMKSAVAEMPPLDAGSDVWMSHFLDSLERYKNAILNEVPITISGCPEEELNGSYTLSDENYVHKLGTFVIEIPTGERAYWAIFEGRFLRYTTETRSENRLLPTDGWRDWKFGIDDITFTVSV